MSGNERREKILLNLKGSSMPIKGGELSTIFEVSRQVIVQDIALLRAEGKDIVATPQGYVLLGNNTNAIKRVIAVKHNDEELEDELIEIVSLGGRVNDVTIEHRIYGEITGRLMIKSIFDVNQFMEKVKTQNSKPLSNLTGGVHIHTIEADSIQIMDRIIEGLRKKGYLIDEEV